MKNCFLFSLAIKKTFIILFVYMNYINGLTQNTYVVDFENFVPAGFNYLNGSEQPFGTEYSFNTPAGPLGFYSLFDTIYGGFWTFGWAISQQQDSSTASVNNVYGVQALKGNNNSDAWAVGLAMSRLRTHNLASGARIKRLFVTNTTYNYKAMKYGLGNSKIFGGTNGSDPDYFKLVIRPYSNGLLLTDSAEIYLADFRFPGASSQDYISNTWNEVNLNFLGPYDSLIFILRSSDVGFFGMNTPPYFAIDDVEVEYIPSSSSYPQKKIPALNYQYSNGDLIVEGCSIGEKILITDLAGKVLLSYLVNSDRLTLSCNAWPTGIYVVQLSGYSFKFFKL